MKYKIIFSIVCIVLLSSLASASMLDSLISYWRYDETTGDARDIFRGNNNGTVDAGVKRGFGGIINNSYNFDDDQNDVLVSNSATLDLDNSGEMALSFWFRREGSLDQATYVIDKGDATSGYLLFFDEITGKHQIEFELYQSDETKIQVDSSVNYHLNNSWNHILIQANGSDVVLYINGTETDKTAYDGTLKDSTEDLSIGYSGSGGGYNFSIDEIGIWNRSLTPLEIEGLYSNGEGQTYPFTAGSVSLTTPSANAGTHVPHFNATLIPPVNGNLTNATLFVWNATNSLINGTETKAVTGGETNTTSWIITLPKIGKYKWGALATMQNTSGDYFEVWASPNATFYYGYKVNSVSYTETVYETTEDRFILNVTITDGTSLNLAEFIYNNTIYTDLSIDSEGNERVITRDLNIPDVNSQTALSFSWNLTIDNYEFFTPTYQQTVNIFEIDDCSTNTKIILNYTMYDEDDRTFLTNPDANATYEIYLKLTGDFTGEVFTYYANSSTSNPLTICVAENLSADTNYRLDSEVKYSASGKVTEFHNVINRTLNESSRPFHYKLYDLATTSSQEFLITVRDSNYIPLDNALIEITRQYLDIGTFLIVELPKTDSDGRTIGHFVPNDVVYTLYVKKNNQLIGTFSNVRVFCADPNGDCRINLDASASTIKPEDFINKNNVSYVSTYNGTTRTYNFIFATTDGSSKVFNITGVKYDGYQNETLCSQQLTASSGTLQCVFPATHQNSTAIVNVYVDGEVFIRSIFPINPRIGASFEALGYIIAFFLILSFPLLAYTSGAMTLIFFVIGLIAVSLLGLLGIGGFVGTFSAFLWIIIAVGVLLWKIKKGGEDG